MIPLLTRREIWVVRFKSRYEQHKPKTQNMQESWEDRNWSSELTQLVAATSFEEAISMVEKYERDLTMMKGDVAREDRRKWEYVTMACFPYTDKKGHQKRVLTHD